MLISSHSLLSGSLMPNVKSLLLEPNVKLEPETSASSSWTMLQEDWHCPLFGKVLSLGRTSAWNLRFSCPVVPHHCKHVQRQHQRPLSILLQNLQKLCRYGLRENSINNSLISGQYTSLWRPRASQNHVDPLRCVVNKRNLVQFARGIPLEHVFQPDDEFEARFQSLRRPNSWSKPPENHQKVNTMKEIEEECGQPRPSIQEPWRNIDEFDRRQRKHLVPTRAKDIRCLARLWPNHTDSKHDADMKVALKPVNEEDSVLAAVEHVRTFFLSCHLAFTKAQTCEASINISQPHSWFELHKQLALRKKSSAGNGSNIFHRFEANFGWANCLESIRTKPTMPWNPVESIWTRPCKVFWYYMISLLIKGKIVYQRLHICIYIYIHIYMYIYIYTWLAHVSLMGVPENGATRQIEWITVIFHIQCHELYGSIPFLKQSKITLLIYVCIPLQICSHDDICPLYTYMYIYI